MRAIALALALIVAMIQMPPTRISPDVPRAFLRASNCADAQHSANLLAAAIGFAHATVTCRDDAARFEGNAPARMPPVPQLIAYNPLAAHAPQGPARVEVPGDVPFVAAYGSVVAYARLDALIVAIATDDPLASAFDLEDAGIRRRDIMTGPTNGVSRLLVRVRPISVHQVLKITNAARKHFSGRYPVGWAVGFVQNCDAAIASLGPFALAQARDHARIMASVARSPLGRLLAIVDHGGGVNNAICGKGAESTTSALGTASLQAPDSVRTGVHLYASVTRALSVAWRMELPPNPPGRIWRTGPGWPHVFAADGAFAEGGAVIPNALEADRVQILVPDWAPQALRGSPYARDLTYVGLGNGPLLPAIELQARNAAQLAQRVAAARADLASRTPAGQSLGVSFVYSRRDCRAAIDAALYAATQDAIARTHAARIRYLQEDGTDTAGPIKCDYQPAPDIVLPESTVYVRGGTIAGVMAGY